MQMIHVFLFLATLVLLFSGCSTEKQQNPTSCDRDFAGVFSKLDGKWGGDFLIFEDTAGQKKGIAQPEEIDTILLKSLPLKVVGKLYVEQEYTSINPYHQKATVKDSYYNKDGTIEVLTSSSVNKVEDCTLKCIAYKDGREITHTGSNPQPGVIIWQRKKLEPLSIDYFKETVTDDLYLIVGWGYYGDDDPDLTPKRWFLGMYYRIGK